MKNLIPKLLGLALGGFLLCVSAFSALAQSPLMGCTSNGLPMTLVSPNSANVAYACRGFNGTSTMQSMAWSEFSSTAFSWSSVTDPNGSVTHQTSPGQANTAYNLLFQNFGTGNKFAASKNWVKVLPANRSWFTPRVTSARVWTPDGRAYLTERADSTASPPITEHLWQAASIIENPVSSIGAHFIYAIEGLGFAAPDIFEGMKAFTNNSETDVGSYTEAGQNLGNVMRGTSGFTNFANARKSIGDRSIAWLNCGGTVSTGAGNCAVVLQFLDSATGKRVTYQGPAFTLAASSSAAVGHAAAESKALSEIAQMGLLNMGTIPPPRMATEDDFRNAF